jgi:hypothetical protein
MKYVGQPQYFLYGSQPQFYSNGRRPQFCSSQLRDLIFGMQHCFNPTRGNMEDDLNCLKMEQDLSFFVNGR